LFEIGVAKIGKQSYKEEKKRKRVDNFFLFFSLKSIY
jgi:hypothetical protein